MDRLLGGVVHLPSSPSGSHRHLHPARASDRSDLGLLQPGDHHRARKSRRVETTALMNVRSVNVIHHDLSVFSVAVGVSAVTRCGCGALVSLG